MRLWTGILFVLALGLFASCAQQSADPVETGGASSFESPYFEVTVIGNGPDIILVPGLASSGAVWDGTVTALKDRYTLHVIQVNGFAGTPANGNAQNEDVLDDLASGVSTYANQMEDAPTLIGHSLGGLVALKTALEPDTNLEHLIIVDVLPFFSVLMDPNATAQSIAPVSAMMKATLLAQSDDVFALSHAEALRALVKSEDDLQMALDWSIDSDRAVMAQAMSEVLVTDLRTQISDISVPTLIIYARDEAIANMDAIESFYETLYAPIADHNLIAVDDALHFVMLDQPVAFLAAIQTVLTES